MMVRILLALALMITPALSHDWYSGKGNMGWKPGMQNPAGIGYPPAKDDEVWGCCGGHDCFRVDDIDQVEELPDRVIITTTGGVKWEFPAEWIQPSEDGNWHYCVWGGRARCIFRPNNV